MGWEWGLGRGPLFEGAGEFPPEWWGEGMEEVLPLQH